MWPLVFETSSAEQTEAVGASLAQKMQDEPLPPFVALYGDLGVGKTAFVRGFASVIAPSSPIKSPTFAMVHEHRGKPRDLFHFDMYRITDEDDLASIGFDDYLLRGGYCLVEWSENIPYALPEEYLRVTITKKGADAPDERRIEIEHIH